MGKQGEHPCLVYLEFEEARRALGALSDLPDNEQTRLASSGLALLVTEKRAGKVSVDTARISYIALGALAEQNRNNESWSNLKTMADRIRSKAHRH